MPPVPDLARAATPGVATPEGRFWIVGGRYRDARYRHLDWTAPAVGPFARRAEAEAVRAQISEVYAAQALVRFSVLEENLAVAA